MIEFVEYTKIAFRGSILQLGALKEEGIGAKARVDPEKCQKKIFAPLPAIFLAGLSTVFLAGLLTFPFQLSHYGSLKPTGEASHGLVRPAPAFSGNPVPLYDYQSPPRVSGP